MGKIEISKIELRIGKQKIAMSVDEAKELLRVLEDAVGGMRTTTWCHSPYYGYYTDDNRLWKTTCENQTLLVDNVCASVA